jgi:type II secretory ATPase GspE/PulE/Tfp pilus assembly ATPase PilB-like protein
MSEPWETAGPAPVTVGMLDGRTLVGTLSKFSPLAMDITLEGIEGAAPTASRKILAAESVAYIGWHRKPGEPPPPPLSKAERFKLHIAGRWTFAVQVREAQGARATGIVGESNTTELPFSKIFFYAHAIQRKERDEPLGEMLVRAGAVGPEAVARAVESQRKQRAVPIGQILVELRRVSAQAVDQALSAQERRRLRIGEVLVEAGLVSEADINSALSEQKKRKGKRLGEVLVEMGIVPEEGLAKTLAVKFGLPFVDLDNHVLDDDAPAAVPRELIARCRLLPLEVTPAVLTVAISDPLALDPLDLLRFHAKRKIEEVLVMPSQLERHVTRWLDRTAMTAQVETRSFGSILGQLVEDAAPAADEGVDAAAHAADGAIVSLVNQMIIDACVRGASDVHIEPNGRERPMVIRLRIDGDCVAYQEIPAAHRASFVARIKIMARLDIAERRKPQDGKIRVRVGERFVELRVAIIPTSTGDEDAVLRVLADAKPLPLERLALSPRNLTELRGLIKRPYGLMLCVGPTGSGKTTTLHSALGAINNTDTKIWTAEDPVEITQPGLRQVQVNARIGYTFAAAMRAFLRGDPDVIMIGEMRDHETAAMAVEASLTGHLVLSTLHTNSAPETVTRLLDMGLDPFSFADSLLGVLAQRLARSLCTACRARRPATHDEIERLVEVYGAEEFTRDFGRPDDDLNVWHAPGCKNCGGTGYRGRVGLHELLVVTDPMRAAIARRAAASELRALAAEGGMRTLVQDGIAKALSGAVDVTQVLAVASR